MKSFFCIIGLLAFSSLAAQRVFYFQPDDFPRGELEEVKLSPLDYDIYVRQICIQSQTQGFTNCPPDDLPDSLTRVEVQYLLKSRNSNRVVYITNYPDQFEELIAARIFDIDSGTVSLNPWYFSKFYIGEYNDSSGQIVFRRSASKTLRITYSLHQDSIFFDRLAIEENTISKTMDINSSLSPRTRFVKQNSFRWFFKEDDDESAGIPLREDTLYVSRKSGLKGIFFRLARQWKGQPCCYIYYKYGRLMTPLF